MGAKRCISPVQRVAGNTHLEGGLQTADEIRDAAELILDVVEFLDVLSLFVQVDHLLQLLEAVTVIRPFLRSVRVVYCGVCRWLRSHISTIY